MKLRLLTSISLFAVLSHKLCAQSADDFFHGGAQSYLTNNVEGARQEVDKGLKLYPDDAKLKKLDELLKQQQQQPQQQQQNQSQQNQSQNQDQQKQDQQQKKDEQKEQDEQKKQQEQKQQQPKQGDQQKQQKEQGQPGQMTPEQAKQMLDAQKSDEMMLPANRNEKHDRQHPLKDW